MSRAKGILSLALVLVWCTVVIWAALGQPDIAFSASYFDGADEDYLLALVSSWTPVMLAAVLAVVALLIARPLHGISPPFVSLSLSSDPLHLRSPPGR
jgi:hypothetical protein